MDMSLALQVDYHWAIREAHLEKKKKSQRKQKGVPRRKSAGAGFKALIVNVMFGNLKEPSKYHPSFIPELKAN